VPWSIRTPGALRPVGGGRTTGADLAHLMAAVVRLESAHRQAYDAYHAAHEKVRDAQRSVSNLEYAEKKEGRPDPHLEGERGRLEHAEWQMASRETPWRKAESRSRWPVGR
jgi:hypothetical protein